MIDSRIAAPVTPLYDTWQVQSASWWTIAPRVSEMPTVSELNSWYAQTAAESLDSLGLWVRPWKIEAYVPSSESQGELRLQYEWQPGGAPEDFLAGALEQIRQVSGKLYGLTLELDLFIWFRAPGQPAPVREWLRAPTKLQIAGPSEDREPYLSFSVAHSVFAAWTWQRGDNSELHSLNQPLLEAALHRWEQRLGPIFEVEGVDVFHYGFHQPRQQPAS